MQTIDDTRALDLFSVPLLEECSREGLEFATANFFSPEREDGSALRLSFGRASEEELRSAARILGENIRRMLSQPMEFARERPPDGASFGE